MTERGVNGFTTRPFPRNRQLVLDAGWMAKRKHMMHGFIEVDVTAARRLIDEFARQNGEKLSFSAFVLSCLGRAVAQDRTVQALRNWRNQLVVFDDVDALLAFEVPAGARTFPLVHPVRGVNRRDVLDIHREIRAVQARPEQSEGMRSAVMRYFYWLPAFVRHLVYWLVEKNPHWRKKYAGTVGLTSVGMFGAGGGWGIGMPTHSLAVTLGGIATKPAWLNGRVTPREFLHVTLSFDHNVIDGAPAARFVQGFRELLEEGYGLEELLLRSQDALVTGDTPPLRGSSKRTKIDVKTQSFMLHFAFRILHLFKEE